MQRLGMGAQALKQKAAAWLEAAKGAGKTAEELIKLRGEVQRLTVERDAAIERSKELSAELQALRNSVKENSPTGVAT
jgi:hypothetical protein